ncbi:hypothetical protein DFE_0982 [Desulfovibrio ferrophilus]|uniref:Uncharacterized protein n=1 Tax=Desulfovibrio ferrophilus TaxID=241368 RepID=A0A2Z6AWY7_9BACT|nr:hypothetical protein DFE_0982 [Desulfovibrio ferrophilus]
MVFAFTQYKKKQTDHVMFHTKVPLRTTAIQQVSFSDHTKWLKFNLKSTAQSIGTYPDGQWGQTKKALSKKDRALSSYGSEERT